MKLHYYPDTDSLYVELRAEPGVDTREVSDGVRLDIGADGAPVGLDIDRASALDLSSLEAVGMPLTHLKAA